MHESGAHAQAPQRRRAQLVGCVLRTRLYDSISSLDVVQQEIAVWMNDLVAQRLGNDKRSAVDDRSGASRRDGRNMTSAAAEGLEQVIPGAGGRCLREHRVARWHLRTADGLRKMIAVGETEIGWNVLGIGCDFANGRDILRTQTTRYAHFVQVGVGDEREQAAMLILPAETPDT